MHLTTVRRLSPIALLVAVACDPAVPADPCAPHGELHDDHCDCDPGFRADGLSCVPRADAGTPDAPPSDAPGATDASTADGCGPHGEQHGDHCHCDPGYVELEGRCVEPPACVGPDDVREENDTAAAASAWAVGISATTLRSCPADEDWFAIPLEAGASIRVDVRFRHATADLDAYLFAPGADPAHDAPIAASDSTDDDEHIDFTATAAGTYLLLVDGYDHRESPYELAID